MEYILTPIMGGLLALLALSAVFIGLQQAQSQPKGVLLYYFHAALATMAVSTALTPRDFSVNELLTLTGEFEVSGISIWSTRFMSLFIGLASLERLIAFFSKHSLIDARAVLLLGFIFFWVTTLLIPLAITANNPLEIKHFYALILGTAIILSVDYSVKEILTYARNALVFFMIASVLFIFIQPNSALDLYYTQGYVSGLPRFLGLTPHATVMGWFSALTVWLLLIQPFDSKKWTILSLLLGLALLLLTQSKTNIAVFMLGSIPVLFYLSSNQQQKFIKPFFYSILMIILLCLIVVFSVFYLNGIENTLLQFLPSDKVNNIISLTGRDIIWEIAMQEFYRNPWFGYGANLFSLSYRESIGLLNATNAHSQYVDTLARSGIVGFIGLMLFLTLMSIKSFRIAKATKGLSVSLILYFLLGSITEVPISLYSIGGTVFTFYLLLFLVSSQEAYNKPILNNKEAP